MAGFHKDTRRETPIYLMAVVTTLGESVCDVQLVHEAKSG